MLRFGGMDFIPRRLTGVDSEVTILPHGPQVSGHQRRTLLSLPTNIQTSFYGEYGLSWPHTLPIELTSAISQMVFTGRLFRRCKTVDPVMPNSSC